MKDTLFDAQVVNTALAEAGWKPARGQGLAEGLAWLVQRSRELDDLRQEHEQVRTRLGERVEQVDELRAKFREEQKTRLRTADRFRVLQDRHAELEAKFSEGWEAERDRLRARIEELQATNHRYADALREIENSDSPPQRPWGYSSRRHQWCVNRARRARKAWMPCDGCDDSHRCRNAYDERNRGRVRSQDCHWSPEEGASR
jgi:hypothetical protein